MLNNYDSVNKTNRVKKLLTDDKFILAIVNKTTVYTGKKLLFSEIEGLVSYIRNININLLIDLDNNTITDKIAKSFYTQLNLKKGNVVDTHEVLKRQIGTVDNDGPDSVYTDVDCGSFHTTRNIKDSNLLNLKGDKGQNSTYMGYVPSNFTNKELETEPETEVKEESKPNTSTSLSINSLPPITQNIYLLLDSKYRNLSTDKNIFSWTVFQSPNTTQGSVNTLIDNIHNIVNVQFERFNIPYVPSADNVYRKISVLIDEFSAMSVLINGGRRYHMMFNSEIQGNQIELSPLENDDGKFRFHTPINILDTITIRFQSPFTPVSFLEDRYNVIITSLNPTQSILTFSEQHQVADGELVHIERFSTLDTTADYSAINTINREEGHIVTFINNNVLRIDVDLSNITPDPNNIASCFIASRRLIIPLRMEYLL